MYAIVDIETTGGHASANGITEVAICLHDGKKVTQRYTTLVNPETGYPGLYPCLNRHHQRDGTGCPAF